MPGRDPTLDCLLPDPPEGAPPRVAPAIDLFDAVAPLPAIELEECDLVMKGGITSGVVYPAAILELKDKYRLRSIGGASAGAIAAATAAAAEYDRDGGGFDRLAAMQAALEAPGAVAGLFQPAPAVAPVFDVLVELTRQARPAAVRGWRRQARWWWARLGAALRLHMDDDVSDGRAAGLRNGAFAAAALLWPAVCLAWVAEGPLRTLAVTWSVAVAAGCLFAGWHAGGMLRFGRRVAGAVRWLASPGESGFGACSGLTEPGRDGPGLTAWLADRLQVVAGLPPDGPPLTLGQLAARGIRVKMVTTNLAHAQPYELPFEDRDVLFRPEELARVFPPHIVAHLVERACRSGRFTPPPGHLFLPKGEDLPLVFVTRLSLSFPFLMSAVRLYTIRAQAYREAQRPDREGPVALAPGDVELNWFSDGGIANNFPIGIFDEWLPRRPTFGINLCDSPVQIRQGARRQGAQAGERASLAHPRDRYHARPAGAPVEDLGGFVGAMVETARASRDNGMAELAAYRERVVHVYFDDHEGGLNLGMEPDTIREIAAKGREAGALLRDRFDFAQHKWVRLRLLLAHIEENLDELRGPDRDVASLRAYIRETVDAQRLAARDPRNRWYASADDRWCDEALGRVEALVGLIERWEAMHEAWHAGHGRDLKFFRHGRPMPDGDLRVSSDF